MAKATANITKNDGLGCYEFRPWVRDDKRRVVAGEYSWQRLLSMERMAAKLGTKVRVLLAPEADIFAEWEGHYTHQAERVLFGPGLLGGLNSSWWHTRATSPSKQVARYLTTANIRCRLLYYIRSMPHVTWLLPTHYPERVDALLPDAESPPVDDPKLRFAPRGGKFVRVPSNMWFGAVVQTQRDAVARIPELMKVPAQVRFAYCVPMVERISMILRDGSGWDEDWRIDAITGREGTYRMDAGDVDPASRIRLVIAAGGTGGEARPIHPLWLRSLRDECRCHSHFVFGGWGDWGVSGQCPNEGVGINVRKSKWLKPDGTVVDQVLAGGSDWANILLLKKGQSGRLLDGEMWDRWPEDVVAPC